MPQALFLYKHVLTTAYTNIFKALSAAQPAHTGLSLTHTHTAHNTGLNAVDGAEPRRREEASD